MSYVGVFGILAAAYGQGVDLYRNGALLGSGRAILRPILDRDRQFVPTDLGTDRREKVLCMAEAALPFGPEAGETVVRQGEDAYDVVNVRPVRVGEELVYWRAILTRRDGEEV